MTIKEIINKFYKEHSTIEITFNRVGADTYGKGHIFTKEEVTDYIKGYENEEVISTIYQTHYTSWRNGTLTAVTMNIPALTITYK